MIRHCVFVRFQSTVTDAEIADMFRDITELRTHLPGILAMHIGDNVSPEKGMDKGFARGFIIDFDSPASRDAYLDDPAHKAAGGKLVSAAVGGTEGILVYDMEL